MAQIQLTMFADQVPLNATEGQTIRVVLLNADGSQSAVLSEHTVPDGKSLAGGYSIGGSLQDAE